jgi:hypothetical protein
MSTRIVVTIGCEPGGETCGSCAYLDLSYGRHCIVFDELLALRPVDGYVGTKHEIVRCDACKSAEIKALKVRLVPPGKLHNAGHKGSCDLHCQECLAHTGR